MKVLHPKVLDHFEHDAKLQGKIHLWGSYFWIINFPFIAYMFFFQPRRWIAIGLVLNTFYSLYANFATDYGALSAAQASAKADPSNKEIIKAIEDIPLAEPQLPEIDY